MFILGVTGQSGAGKGLVCQRLSELGFFHIDADKTARLVVEKGKPCLEKLVDKFSREILNSDGTLNRKSLAHLAFSCGGLESLNNIILPYVIDEIKKTCAEQEKKGIEFVALDAPTLFESKADQICSKILYVTADSNLRKRRIIVRDKISEDLANERIDAQQKDEYYKSKSDYIIENNSGSEELIKQVDELFHTIKKL